MRVSLHAPGMATWLARGTNREQRRRLGREERVSFGGLAICVDTTGRQRPTRDTLMSVVQAKMQQW